MADPESHSRGGASWILGVFVAVFLAMTMLPLVSGIVFVFSQDDAANITQRTLSATSVLEDGTTQVDFQAPLLTYSGHSGAMVMLAKLAVVIAGFALSVFARGWVRRIGLGIVLLWAGLWLYSVFGFCRYADYSLCQRVSYVPVFGTAVCIAWTVIRWKLPMVVASDG